MFAVNRGVGGPWAGIKVISCRRRIEENGIARRPKIESSCIEPGSHVGVGTLWDSRQRRQESWARKDNVCFQ